MKVDINKIIPNPFKKFVNEGKLEDSRLSIFEESIEMGTLPNQFYCRKNNGKYELIFGHHRLQAFKNKGIKQVEITLRKYTDEQMLIDLVRENITQRDTDFHDTKAGIVLARQWLQSKCQHVKQFNKQYSQVQKGKKDFQVVPDSYRSITKFLSKNGKAVSYVTVKHYLDLNDKLNLEILSKVKKFKGHEDKKDGVTVREAVVLSKFEKEEQPQVLQLMRNESGPTWQKEEMINKFKNAPDNIKQAILDNKLKLSNIDFIMEQYEDGERIIAKQNPDEVYLELLEDALLGLKEINADRIKKIENDILKEKCIDRIKQVKQFLDKILNELNEVNIIEIGGKIDG